MAINYLTMTTIRIEEIYTMYDNLQSVEGILREQIRRTMSSILVDTSENNPRKIDIPMDWVYFAMSTLEMPHIDSVWQVDREGYIMFTIDGSEVDFDNMSTEELIQVLKEIS